MDSIENQLRAGQLLVTVGDDWAWNWIGLVVDVGSAAAELLILWTRRGSPADLEEGLLRLTLSSIEDGHMIVIL